MELLDELSYRKRPNMVKLRQQVKEHFENIDTFTQVQPQNNSPRPKAKSKPEKKRNSPALKSAKMKPSQKYKDPFAEMDYLPEKTARIHPAGELTDVPPKFLFERKTKVKLNLNGSDSLRTTYETCLKALIDEMRKKGTGAKQITLENGVRTTFHVSSINYQFPYEGDVDLFEGARIKMFLGSSQTDGQIESVHGNKIIISVQSDFGENIDLCQLKIDNTAMLEALMEIFIKIGNNEYPHFNEDLAKEVITNKGEVANHAIPPNVVGIGDLNPEQCEAVCAISTNKIFYLWGPPGTGKTKTISTVCLNLLNENKKILLCSNTNQAVDQVLLKLCAEFNENHPALLEGHIVRIGKIIHEELESKWKQYVSLDGIVERKSESLLTEKKELENKLKCINQESANSYLINEEFKLLDKFGKDLNILKEKITKTESRIQDGNKQKELQVNKAKNLQIEKNKIQKAVFSKIFRRSIKAVDNDIASLDFIIAQTDEDIVKAEKRDGILRSQKVEKEKKINLLRNNLKDHDREIIEEQVQNWDNKKQEIINGINVINKELEDIKKTVLNQARIVGATATKTYLSPQLFSDFDVVIIDEASMVIMPALFYVAGLAKGKVVISGDFNQLSPIIQTDEEEIYNILGTNIFHTSGIVEDYKNDRPLKHGLMLQMQYRMDNEICKIVSNSMYKGKLKTAPDRKPEDHKPPPPFHLPLTIVDTSTIFPFSSRDPFKSRFNLMHALAIRNLCRHLRANGYTEIDSIGVCTPYTAQAKLLNRILNENEEKSEIAAGTVHRYQGDEKSLMILDIPDSLGERYAGIFLQADNCDDDGAKLFNVAISRAKNHLIVFANLAFLDKKLPNRAILRNVLYQIQKKGTVVDVRDVISLWPILEDLKKYGESFDLSQDAERAGLFNQKDFEVVCKVDMSKAKKSIVIFSGFITEQRVAAYESLFRLKIAEGIKIKCVTRPPSRNGSIPEESGKLALNGLEAMGCIVDTRSNIHEKAVIIDGEIAWFGSLNPLSHTSKTAEMMARVQNKKLANQLAIFLSINRKIKLDDTNELLCTKENPACPKCNARMAYMIGKYGPYWGCEECDCTENTIKMESRYSSNIKMSKEKIPVCPNPGCNGIKMTVKSGQFGEFYGCPHYPDCKETVKI